MEKKDSRKRVVITNVSPSIEEGRFAAKRIIGDEIEVEADVFVDGHSEVLAQLLYRLPFEKRWREVSMQPIENDRFKGSFKAEKIGNYLFTIRAWVDTFGTWQKDLQKKILAKLDILPDLPIGLEMINRALGPKDKKNYAALLSSKDPQKVLQLALDEKLHRLVTKSTKVPESFVTRYPKHLAVMVEPRLAQFSAWYELFARSCSSKPNQHGTFKDLIKWLPEIAKMGFDVLYLPPIHPIGKNFRKGKDNSLKASASDPGSPWAIGSKDGGHKAIHKELGTAKDFDRLLVKAKALGLSLALDLAFQCSPDHPYLSEHRDWFLQRPDGSIKHAENPPKKYEDIVPFNFETESFDALWDELASIVFYWIDKGVCVFRVDNPHTKPFAFWHWLIRRVKEKHPEVIFLSEAFTRPKVMHWLAKVGFSQSYTYFTWRYTKGELTRYFSEITKKEILEYFRPNLWPNTPDILPIDLQYDGKATFMSRLILAATLSSNYGVYGPPYELMLNQATGNTEEYLHAEKYEIALWDPKRKSPIKDLMTQINQIRRQNPALQRTNNLKFYEIDNSQLLYYAKFASCSLLLVVSVDPFEKQSATLKIPLNELGIRRDQSYRVHELLQDRHLIWEGDEVEIAIDPKICPARIYRVQTPMLREKGFEYFM